MVVSLLMAIFVPSLTAVVTTILSSKEDDRRSSQNVLREANVDWDRGSPELVLPLLDATQQYSFQVAAREETIDGETKVTGVVTLEVQLIER